jgi:hypothetical protein
LLKFELFLFRQVVIPKDDLKDPLAWLTWSVVN